MIPQRLEDFPPDARWVQTQRGVVIVCKDGTVYRRDNGRTVELQDPPTAILCGRCLGRGKTDIAHGETAPCENCNGTGFNKETA